MGQIVSAAAKPKRCNANQLSQVPTPAAGEYILVSSDNSMNAAGQGNFDCYIMGDGTTAATSLTLHKMKAEELDEQLNGIPSYDQIISIPTTAGSSISKSTKHAVDLEVGKVYTITPTWANIKAITIYLYDASGTAVQAKFDGASTGAFNSSLSSAAAPTRTLEPLAPVKKVAFYASDSNVTGSGGVDVNIFWQTNNIGDLAEIDGRLDSVEPKADTAYNDAVLFEQAFDVENSNAAQTIDKYIRYSDGAEQTAGSASKMEEYKITLSGEYFIAAYLGSSDNVPAAIAFYNSSTISAGSYMKDASVQIEATTGKWFCAFVPEGAVLAVITNKYGLVANKIIRTMTDERFNALALKTNTAYNDALLFEQAFDVKQPSITPTTDKYVNYSTGNVATAGSSSKCELYRIDLDGEFYIKAFVGFSDDIPAAIAFYNSATPSTSSYMQSASVHGQQSYGQWYSAPVPAGAVTALISNKYSYVEDVQIITISSKNIGAAMANSVKADVNKSAYQYSPLTNAPFFAHHVPISFVTAENGDKLIAGESIESVAFSARLGFKFIEANVHKTSDDEYIVMHGDSGNFGTQVYATNGDSISSVAISSKTLDYIKTYVRFNATWDKYKTPVATLDEFLDACAQNNIGCLCGSTDPTAIAKCIDKLGPERVILYDAPVSTRSYFGGIMDWWYNVSGKTIAGLLQDAQNYGRPFISVIGPTVISEFKTQGILKDFVDTMHENGFLAGFASVYQTEEETCDLLAMGFDFSASGAEVNYFEGGTIYDINTPTNIVTTGTITQGVATLAAGNTLTCGDTTKVGLGKMYLRIKFTGELSISFGSRVARTFSSDGSKYLVLSDFSMQRRMQLIITALEATTISDFVYKTTEC